jgi:uncharacterized protein (TIGR00369 family)
LEREERGVEEVRQLFERSEFHSSWMRMRLERVEPGEVDVAMDVGDRHLNLMGTLHGGLIATLADTATGLALRSVLDPGLTFTTTHLGVTFLSPGRRGSVVARGRVVRSGRRLGYAEADVVDPSGRLLARAAATFAIMAEPEPRPDAERGRPGQAEDQ